MILGGLHPRRGDWGQAGDLVHGEVGGVLLGAAGAGRDQGLTCVNGGAAPFVGAAAGFVGRAVD